MIACEVIVVNRRSEKMVNAKKQADGKFCFAIDRGGTFTDVWARCPDGRIQVLKLLSEDPQNYADAPTEAIRRVLEKETASAPTTNGCVTHQMDSI